jgi:L-ascorbate metabolism protein UlaG (beta-lactamase superfamily)
VEIDEGFSIDVLPARHFSGRGFRRNNAMWVSFAVTTPSIKLYLGGDSGYDDHFRRIGETHGPFDLAILECGQYDKSWKYIHMMPEEVVQAALDLDASKLMPVHWGKFSLSNHAWDEPIIRVANAAADKGLPLITPLIGERVELSGTRAYKAWWTAFEK